MKLNELHAAEGSRVAPYRKGRGLGSGNGKTGGRGQKGQKARAGGGVRPGFEGGQTPLYRRIPKRGFNNKNFRPEYTVINVEQLNVFEDGTEVDVNVLVDAGMIKKCVDGISVLGNGTLTKKLTVKAAKFSATATEKIESLGGKAEVI